MSSPTVERAGTSGRDFSGIFTQYVVDYLNACAPEGTLERVLRSAGEVRSADMLSDASTWSSYAQLRKLLEATGEALGGPGSLRVVGQHTFDSIRSPELSEAMLALGSPAAVFSTLSGVNESLAPHVELTTENTSLTECEVELRVKDGYDPFPELCGLELGILSSVPVLFGYPVAEVLDETCQYDGAPSCHIRLRWQATDSDEAKVALAELRSRISEARLEEFQRTVAQLVSGDGLEAVLTRVTTAAGRAVPAWCYILDIRLPASAERWTSSEGIEPAERARIIEQLNATPPADVAAHMFVADVASDRDDYGRLVAIRPETATFEPLERSVLESYARLAASALDSEAAIVDARQQAAAAHALLSLSSSLADLASAEEMIVRLARAVPSVIDCDRVAVSLTDSDSNIARVGATHGFDHATDAELRSLHIPVWPVDPSTGGDVGQRLPEDTQEFRAVLKAADSMEIFSLPITYNDEMYGWITVDVTDRPERISDSVDIAERLRGLAGQAAIAIRNARLLDEIRHQALHDSLTGLPNRVLLIDRVKQTLSRARRDHHSVALLFIDLDSFKDINDTLGHASGDALLQAVADRFTRTLRDSDTVARIGGDEFVVLAEGITLAAGPELVAERLLGVLEEPFHLTDDSDSPVTTSASIGIAVGPRDSAEDLLRDADVALYAAKTAGGRRYMFFEEEMQAALQTRHNLEVDLQAALDSDQYFLLYQPIFDLVNMQVVGVESLLRWRHPIRGLLEPDEFIPVLESSGLIIPVGRWVLMEACRQAMIWRKQGHLTRVSVNASARQLDADSLLDDVQSALDVTGLPPDGLIIEITETSLMRDTQGTIRQLTALKTLGVRIAIDDFGTGYSSLAYLQQFPVDCLKIDRSFISGMAKSPEGDALIHTLMQLGKALSLETLAEGIEEAGQLTQLQAEQCDVGQGYLFARPLAADKIQGLL
jgi:diguanylate cyclase (GGDEF)-like protein